MAVFWPLILTKECLSNKGMKSYNKYTVFCEIKHKQPNV